MHESPHNLTALPSEIAGHRVVRRLNEASYHCLAPGERQVVLKMLDAECIVGGQLHPSIKERLARVRELAHRGVANLYGVERDDGSAAWLVWEHVDGPTLADYVAGQPSMREACVVVRELILAIEALHACGIVHGAIHERNVIVERSAEVRLTHVSPLLYTDPGDDATALLDVVEQVGCGPFQPLCTLARAARDQPQPLRWLRGKLAELIDERPVSNAAADAEPMTAEPASGRAAVIAAVVLLLVGIAIAVGVVYWVQGRTPVGSRQSIQAQPALTVIPMEGLPT